jgi:hypothetical protein
MLDPSWLLWLSHWNMVNLLSLGPFCSMSLSTPITMGRRLRNSHPLRWL